MIVHHETDLPSNSSKNSDRKVFLNLYGNVLTSRLFHLFVAQVSASDFIADGLHNREALRGAILLGGFQIISTAVFADQRRMGPYTIKNRLKFHHNPKICGF